MSAGARLGGWNGRLCAFAGRERTGSDGFDPDRVRFMDGRPGRMACPSQADAQKAAIILWSRSGRPAIPLRSRRTTVESGSNRANGGSFRTGSQTTTGRVTSRELSRGSIQPRYLVHIFQKTRVLYASIPSHRRGRLLRETSEKSVDAKRISVYIQEYLHEG